VGYVFTPSADLLVTHFRHYAGKKVTVWTEAMEPLASMNVTSTPGSWVETPLPASLLLKAGQSYVVAVYTEAGFYYRRTAPGHSARERSIKDSPFQSIFFQSIRLRSFGFSWI